MIVYQVEELLLLKSLVLGVLCTGAFTATVSPPNKVI
jgi:hypothetical protein